MKYTKENLSASKVKYNIALAPDEVARHHAAAAKKLSRNVKVAGFRKGHVPPEVAEKHLDPAKLADEAINSAVNAALVELVRSDNLQILDRPDIAITKFVPAQTLEFTATVEIVPPVKLADFTKLKARRETTKISDKEIDEVVERLRTGAATKTEAKRAAKLGDEVVIDFTGFKDGEKFDGGAATDFALELGSNSFIPGFEDGIVGHKAGNEFDLLLTFPDDYGAKNLAGAKAVFKIKLKKVNAVELPKLDDKFAATISPDFKTLDDLKNDIRRELAARADYDAEQKFRDDLLNELAEKSNVATPEILIDDQEKTLEQQFVQNLAYRGTDLAKYLADEKLTRDEWVAKELRPTAEKRVRNSLTLAELAREWQIAATDDEVDAMQAQIAAQYTDLKLRENFETPEARRQISQQIITENTLKKLAELNTK